MLIACLFVSLVEKEEEQDKMENEINNKNVTSKRVQGLKSDIRLSSDYTHWRAAETNGSISEIGYFSPPHFASI